MVRDGLDAARRDAELAVALEGPQSPWRPVALLQLAMTQVATGETESAVATLSAGVEASRALELAGPLIAHLSVQAQLALDRGDQVTAEGLATSALAVVRRARMEEYGASLLCRAVLAGFTGRRGDRTLAKRELASLQHLRVKVSSPTPLLSVFWLRALVRAHADAHDLPGAWTALREIEHIMRSRPELGQVALSIVELRRMLAADGSGEAGPSTLTNAEMRVLQLLPTHLSLPEIADRLVVAYSTVKAQAHAIYGKLGASTRTEAVRAAFDAGLLEPELQSLARYALGEAPSDTADID
jgi:LuxR family maltose regulon positive regulatory protein